MFVQLKQVIVGNNKVDHSNKGLFLEVVSKLGKDSTENSKVLKALKLQTEVHTKDHNLISKVSSVGNVALKWKKLNLKYKVEMMRWYNIKDIITLLTHFKDNEPNSDYIKVKKRLWGVYDITMSEDRYNNTVANELKAIKKEYGLELTIDDKIKRVQSSIESLIKNLSNEEKEQVIGMLLKEAEVITNQVNNTTTKLWA